MIPDSRKKTRDWYTQVEYILQLSISQAKALFSRRHMKYIMRQKILAWGDDYTIRDEAGNDVYFVDGKVFSIGQKLSFQDMSGNELAFIRQRLLSWGPTYEVFVGGRQIAEVRKQLFTFFKCRFTVDVPGPDDVEATGDFLDYEYEFRRGDTVVGRVSKRWFSWSDTYGIEVLDPKDTLVVLTATVVIDAVCHQEQKNN
jgi:uncharacterized protein YxjI